MHFEPTPEQRELCLDTRSFSESQLGVDLRNREEDSQFPATEWQSCAAKGILGLNTPANLGGQGHDVLTSVLMLEALGYGCPDNGLTLGINGQVWCVQAPLLKFGSKYQHEKYVQGMVSGAMIGAHAMTEPEAGSDAFAMKTTAQERENDFVLNGRKIYVGLAPIADCILAFASTDPSRGRWGVTAFVIDANSPGVVLQPNQPKMGLRTLPTGEIHFNNTSVPKQNVVGRVGSGAAIFNASMDYERSFIFASHVGSMARQLDEAVQFAKDRKQQGQPIGRFQSISNRIADMKVRLDTAQLMLRRSAWLVDQGKSIPMEAATTNLVISEAFVANSLSSIRIHGGRGYLSEFEIERDLRDAVGGLIYSGTSDIQRNLIARMLGL